MTERVYEMLWDCAYCGTRKLLGKTHRFCPKCGGPQDPERRYFPSEEDKVAVEDHVYVGADRVCPNCSSAMSARAAHCTQCGAPLEGAAEVQRVPEAGPVPKAAPAAAAKPGRGLASCLLPVLGVVLLLAAGLLVALFWKKEEQAQVAEATWERSVVVEALTPRRDSAWCDSMPREARDVTRRREVRSHRRVQAGEDCATRRVDRGDGTFAERRECAPRFRDEPIHDQKCEFTVDRWGQSRREVASGTAAQAPAPYWPRLALRGGDCRGCEREGARQTSYKVALLANGRRFVCDVGEGEWPSFTPGSSWSFEVGVVTRSPDCKSLRRVSGN